MNQSFAKTGARRSGWSATTARTQSPAQSMVSRLERFGPCAERLTGVSIEHCDGIDLVARLARKGTVVYADPPYLAAVRSGLANNRVSDYRHDMSHEDDHRRLAEVLNATPADVILSGYPGALYDELYADWCIVDHGTTVGSSNARRNDRGARTERLWLNYEPPGRLAYMEAL